MNRTDVILTVLLLLGAWSGYRKGFLMALFSLAAFLLGLFGAYHLMGDGVVWLGSKIEADPELMPYISFMIIFLLIVIAVKIIGSILRASIAQTVLGQADNILGAILGILRYSFMVSVVIWILTSLHFRLPEDWRKDSVMLPVVEKTAPYIAGKAGSMFPSVSDLFKGF
ncbi:MAG: CvpA family protein [Cyclobacteriaceae bacterium]